MADSFDAAAHVIHETIEGGFTRDNLYSCYRIIGAALPICILMNSVTAVDVMHFNGPMPERQKLLTEAMVTIDLDGIPTHLVHRDVVPDDQVRIFASDGRLYVFDFV